MNLLHDLFEKLLFLFIICCGWFTSRPTYSKSIRQIPRGLHDHTEHLFLYHDVSLHHGLTERREVGGRLTLLKQHLNKQSKYTVTKTAQI